MQKSEVNTSIRLRCPTWLPVVAAMALMAMVVLMAAVTMNHLNRATEWRRYSAEAILSEQSFQNNVLEMQQGLRGYVTAGDSNSMEMFCHRLALEPSQLKRLWAFSRDDPAQQKCVGELATAMTNLISFDNKAIAIFKVGGVAGIENFDETWQGRGALNRVEDVLNQYSSGERNLWNQRDVSEQREYRHTVWILIGGSVLAAVLLAVAYERARRELAYRHRAEAKLNQTLLLQNAILDSSDYGIVATNQEGVVQTFNRAAERVLGYLAAEIIGKETPILWRDPLELAERAEILSKKLGIPVRPTFDAIAKKVQSDSVDDGEWTFIRKDGTRFLSHLVVTPLGKDSGDLRGFILIFRDISERKRNEVEREQLIAQLKQTLAEVKTLSGLIPICAWCKNVRSDTGYWQTVEQYVRNHSDAVFSHGVCPTCAARFKDEIVRANQRADALAKA